MPVYHVLLDSRRSATFSVPMDDGLASCQPEMTAKCFRDQMS